MRLRNSTTIPTDLLREIVLFVRPSGVAAFDCKLANCKNGVLKGKAYPEGSGYHDRACAFVNLYVGPDRLFPNPPQPPVRSNYLPRPYLANREEALVYVAAHELRHLWQANVRRGRRVWGARGQYSERDADAYAIRMLREWRKRA